MADGQILSQESFRYGLREVGLIREPLPEEGESFTVAVNGYKVYCKGADWVPADSLMARMSPTKYRELVRLASEANFNMFRVWGGGVYEDPYSYQLCDEFGILVWQDFMYACSYYPDDDPGFVAVAHPPGSFTTTSSRGVRSRRPWRSTGVQLRSLGCPSMFSTRS